MRISLTLDFAIKISVTEKGNSIEELFDSPIIEFPRDFWLLLYFFIFK